MNKNTVNLISKIAPNLVVSFAYKQLTSPQVKKLRPNELEVLDKSNKEIFDFQDFKIQLYHWKGEGESVFLIHGWEGQAGNFSDLIKKLIQKKYNIYAFDAPSHGFSSGGKTSLFEFSELVGVLIEKHKVKKLISHSFGGVATTFALLQNPKLEIEKYALLTTPDKFSERIDFVAEQVGITENVKQKLIQKLENQLDMKVKDLNVSNAVKTIKVQKSLIIHDKNDKIINIEQSRNVQKNWKNCELVEIEGTGHFRILRTDFVLDKVLDFLENN